jgi:uroporphyrinogen III methyltransferase/synthase
MNLPSPGIVFLVGAGPGDPGLITLRGVQCLQKADVIVHDRLVNRLLLAYAPQAEWIDVGKRPDHHPVPQEQINALLVQNGLAGKTVVRLKGGDPFVFGRGGEEALALTQAGVPFEIVPGVTSAIAAPAYAGIPITQRDLACSAVLITGHRADCSADPGSDWQRAARGADTLVFLMGVHNLTNLVEQLLASGRSPDTPVAIIERATTPNQKTVTGNLSNIVSRAANTRPPAVIVVGEVVSLRQGLAWYERPAARPLLGQRILNTRPLVRFSCSSRAGVLHASCKSCFTGGFDAFSVCLAELGAEVIELPTSVLRPATDFSILDEAIHKLYGQNGSSPFYDWLLFANAYSAVSFCDRLFALGLDARAFGGVRLAAIGQTTVAALEPFGLRPDFVTSCAEDLPSASGRSDLSGLHMLVSGSDPDSPGIGQQLRALGAQVDVVQAYQSQPLLPNSEDLNELVERRLDIAAFFDPSALYALASRLAELTVSEHALAQALTPLRVVCSGENTLRMAQKLGVRVDLFVPGDGVEEMCLALTSHIVPLEKAEA